VRSVSLQQTNRAQIVAGSDTKFTTTYSVVHTNPGRKHWRRATCRRTADAQRRPPNTVQYTRRRRELLLTSRWPWPWPWPQACRSWPTRRRHALVSLELVGRQDSCQRQLLRVSNTFSVRTNNTPSGKHNTLRHMLYIHVRYLTECTAQVRHACCSALYTHNALVVVYLHKQGPTYVSRLISASDDVFVPMVLYLYTQSSEFRSIVRSWDVAFSVTQTYPISSFRPYRTSMCCLSFPVWGSPPQSFPGWSVGTWR